MYIIRSLYWILRGRWLIFVQQKIARQIIRQLKRGSATEHRIIIIGSPLHSNLGDHAIAIAMLAFCKKMFPASTVIEIPGAIFNKCADVFCRLINPNDRIAVVGGGFLGTLWLAEEEMVRSVIRDFPNNRIVIFPQTVYYDSSAECIREKVVTRLLYQSHTDLHLFIRDHSINLVRNELCGRSFYDVRPAPDIALFMNKSTVKYDRSGVVLCFRSDKESVYSVKVIDAIQSQAAGFGERVRKVDTVVSHEVFLKTRERELDQILTEFCRTRLVITDRLHGMIFSAITGTPCIALNNSSGKVNGVWSLWLQHLTYIKLVKSPDDIPPIFGDMLAMGATRYDPLPFGPFWDDIADVIRGFK